jgi:hypothetical protein
MTGTTLQRKHAKMKNLAVANEVRTARCAKLNELRSLSSSEGGELAADLIRFPPDYMRSMLLYDLLVTIRYFGKEGARRMLRKCELPAYLSVGELTERQRAVIAVHLVWWARERPR